MTVFVDTSALYALVDPDDADHAAATSHLAELAASTTRLVTHDYVVVEATALVQRRLGMDRVGLLHRDVLSAIDARTVEADVRDQAVAALLASDRRGVSLVDRVSFAMMQRLGVDTAFAFDADFADQGFSVVP